MPATYRLNKSVGERQYKTQISKVPNGLGATTANIQRLLRSIDFVGWSTHEESGRLDRRALTRFGTGSTNIFSRRDYKPAESSAVSVLIDCSSSMEGGRINIAEYIAVHLSSILSRSRVPFTVNGFQSSGVAKERINRDSNGVDTYAETPTFIPFKPWNKSLQSCIPALGSVSSCADGGTPDYSSIYNAIDDLSRRSETRKILFLLTDAAGYDVSHMQHLQSLADKLGVTIVAIGIHAYDVTKCFVNSVSVGNLSDLTSVAFNTLLKTVQRKLKCN